MNNSVANGVFWKLLERFGVQGVQFVLQIVLARLLSPDDYGVLSMMIIFTLLANVFIQNGFNTALIQDKDVSEEDYSSTLWVVLSIAGLLYLILFCSAPVIAEFYNMPSIVLPFRVLCLMVLPGAWNSIQLAKVSRELDFKKVFNSNVLAVSASGILGIILAINGFGVWALVIQNLSNIFIACIVMSITVSWRPRLVLNLSRVNKLFSFGWKILVANLIDMIYQDLSSLVIGKKFNSAMLGYYNRGKQFPQFINNSVNGAVQSVMLPAMSAKQKDIADVKNTMRTAIRISTYIVFPIMAGLVAISKPLISILLTDKWLPCVEYMQIFCVALAVFPIHSCNLQAFNAIGKSEIYLRLEIIKKGIGIMLLLGAVFLFKSISMIAWSTALTSYLSFVINAIPNKKVFGYTYAEQIRDIFPSLIMSMIMCIITLQVEKLGMNDISSIACQLVVGVLSYLILSVATHNEELHSIVSMINR
ncbi:lipopolysaccharide biosynthesis protein [Lacrimispora saccharolytica]|uniref:lipopolysaccharide biosynthesis protein n=1 Tax=Lacrimispora saccharolytica TaxID=84030 RepID=UPI00265D4878|nr:lipopolysaccharide biosynthesis protein [Lacrimispora saccharolytica]MCF2657185.1 lipopolysaccharide biosynthesis protein [Lacrimispora saccharolytica]